MEKKIKSFILAHVHSPEVITCST